MSHDIDADPLTVHCPDCGVIAGDTCPGKQPCKARPILARVMARRAIEAERKQATFRTGLAKVREALEAGKAKR